MDETQKHFVVRYLIARARLRPGRGTPSMTALEQEIAHGYKLLAGGVWSQRGSSRGAVGEA
jgi:hypothetical protein